MVELPAAELRRLAMKALEGVGETGLGQWEEEGVKAYHVRRRLSESEAAAIGPAVDLRGTKEGLARFLAIRRYIPPGMEAHLRSELEPAR